MMDFEQELKDREQGQQHLAELFKEDLAWLLDDQRGRRIIARLLDETEVFSSTFTGNSASYYRDGRKSVGLEYFKSVMELDPNRFVQLHNEYQTTLKRFAKSEE